MIERLRENILFIGISSFEDFPKPSVNPFSPKFVRRVCRRASVTAAAFVCMHELALSFFSGLHHM